jgi:Tfp pilus assembly protein PilO
MNMKLSKKDAQLLIILGGLLVFLALYMMVFNHFQTKSDEVAQNIATLEPQLQELESEYANLATYQNGIEQYRSMYRQAQSLPSGYQGGGHNVLPHYHGVAVQALR